MMLRREEPGSLPDAFIESAEPADEPDVDFADTINGSGTMFARHVCPQVCPKGVKVLPAGSAKNNGGSVVFCCRARVRKTVTKRVTRTIVRTKRVTRTIARTKTTSVKAKVTIRGRLFYDNDRNGIYTNPPDIPIANTPIVLIVNTAVKRLAVRGQSIIGSTTTDSTGSFVVVAEQQKNGTEVLLFEEGKTDGPPLTSYTSNGGTANVVVTIPILLQTVGNPRNFVAVWNLANVTS
jgi:hypothetical protein